MNAGLGLITNSCFCSDEEINLNNYIKMTFDCHHDIKMSKTGECLDFLKTPYFFSD